MRNKKTKTFTKKYARKNIFQNLIIIAYIMKETKLPRRIKNTKNYNKRAMHHLKYLINLFIDEERVGEGVNNFILARIRGK